jgi:signal transduction histidine kinase
MASIYGFSELLLSQDFDAEDQRDFLSTIFRQSELMVSIINELLDLARIEARRGKDFVIARFDLRALIDEIVAGFKPPGDRASPQKPAADGPLWVSADQSKMIQAISNVLSNAYKYSPEGGPVKIEFITPEQSATALAGGPGPTIGIRIIDSGIGMSQEQLSRVFERFYRADTSGKIPGTGLGMSIVKEIVELHGGRIDIQSETGSGTSVSLLLPSASSADRE